MSERPTIKAAPVALTDSEANILAEREAFGLRASRAADARCAALVVEFAEELTK
jgi:hypothetical protein